VHASVRSCVYVCTRAVCIHLHTQFLSRPDGWLADVYETTPPMSTYLLAFIVCDFVHINGTTPKGIEVRVFNLLVTSPVNGTGLSILVGTSHPRHG